MRTIATAKVQRNYNCYNVYFNECLLCKMADADVFSATLFLTVEALDTREYSAVEFYQKCGFQFSDVAQNKYNYESIYGNQTTTRRMYKLIIPIE